MKQFLWYIHKDEINLTQISLQTNLRFSSYFIAKNTYQTFIESWVLAKIPYIEGTTWHMLVMSLWKHWAPYIKLVC